MQFCTPSHHPAPHHLAPHPKTRRPAPPCSSDSSSARREPWCPEHLHVLFIFYCPFVSPPRAPPPRLSGHLCYHPEVLAPELWLPHQQILPLHLLNPQLSQQDTHRLFNYSSVVAPPGEVLGRGTCTKPGWSPTGPGEAACPLPLPPHFICSPFTLAPGTAGQGQHTDRQPWSQTASPAPSLPRFPHPCLSFPIYPPSGPGSLLQVRVQGQGHS